MTVFVYSSASSSMPDDLDAHDLATRDRAECATGNRSKSSARVVHAMHLQSCHLIHESCCRPGAAAVPPVSLRLTGRSSAMSRDVQRRLFLMQRAPPCRSVCVRSFSPPTCCVRSSCGEITAVEKERTTATCALPPAMCVDGRRTCTNLHSPRWFHHFRPKPRVER